MDSLINWILFALLAWFAALLLVLVGEMNESCFSAVKPVIGWNQWQKWLAPFSIAHSLTAWATTSAIEPSSRWPRRMVSWSAS